MTYAVVILSIAVAVFAIALLVIVRIFKTRVDEMKGLFNEWRADTKEMYQERLEELRTLLQSTKEDAYAKGLSEGHAGVGTYTFSKRLKKNGLFLKESTTLALAIAVIQGTIKSVSGDFDRLELFELPPWLKKAIEGAIAAGLATPANTFPTLLH
jgi:hypothetical protein